MMRDFDGLVADLRAHRDRLAAELDRVDAALAALSGDEPGSARKVERGPASTPMADRLNAMFEEYPETEFSAESALETLVEDGWQSDAADPVNAMRTALSRMVKRGEIHRVGRGLYRKRSTTEIDPWATPDTGGDDPPF